MEGELHDQDPERDPYETGDADLHPYDSSHFCGYPGMVV